MNKEIKVKVGDTVLYHGGSFGGKSLPVITKVKTITPTGRIRVECSPSEQFNKYGWRMGGDCWSRSSIEVPNAEKLQEVRERTFIRRTIHQMQVCKENEISYEQAVAIMKVLKGGDGDD